MTMMLECNLELFDRVLLLANASKSVRISSHETRISGVGQDLQVTRLALQSQTSSVGWSEPENIYFLSHDIRVFYI